MRTLYVKAFALLPSSDKRGQFIFLSKTLFADIALYFCYVKTLHFLQKVFCNAVPISHLDHFCVINCEVKFIPFQGSLD